MGVEIKICGLTRAADAAVAVAAGASYLGVVFAGGPRLVTSARAREIAAAAEGTPVIAVIGSATTDAVLRLRDRAGFSGVQLHGEHADSMAARLRDEGLLVWEVARLDGAESLQQLPRIAARGDAILIEPRVAGVLGGSGTSLSLELAARAREQLTGFRMVLAGGLTPETVGTAIQAARPEVVDVSSGVETAPGIKDPARISRFVEAVVGHHSPA
ncbi:MAG TPA: hypothetical protein VMJ30_06710 [Gemmatimonadales bacterium]|nr:hypothetical protein [Gemmatimonadales bacterium]